MRGQNEVGHNFFLDKVSILWYAKKTMPAFEGMGCR